MTHDSKIPVLFISYLFPPRGGVGVQRITKFVKYLPGNGFLPIVLTVKKPEGSVAEDLSLLDEIPGETKIYRTDSFEPYHLYHALGGVKKQDDPSFRQELVAGETKKSGLSKLYFEFQRRYLIPDPKIGWLLPAMKQAGLIVKKHSPALVLSTSPESTAHLIALKIHRRYKIPFIADFRDPWIGGYYSLNRPQSAAKRELRMEDDVLKEASAVTVVMNEYIEGFKKNHTGLDFSRFHVIHNGFDESDYRDLTIRKFPGFTIVHTGSIYHQRSPVPFFKAVSGLLKRNPDARKDFKIQLLGKIDESFLSDARLLQIDDLIGIEPFKSHQHALETQLAADILLILSEGVMTAKIYEYLRARKPIIGFAPDGELTRQVSNWGVGKIFKPDDVIEASNFLEELYNNWSQGLSPVYPLFKTVELSQYERSTQTRELSRIMKNVLSG
jgi:glycosyltransferase involved in cell wall biosynthesis